MAESRLEIAPGVAWLTKVATWRRQEKKPLALHEITKLPGPMLRPALCRYENRAP